MDPTVQSLIETAHEAVIQGRHGEAAALLNQALQRTIEAGEGDGAQATGIREDLATLQEMTEVSAFRKELGLTRLPGEPATPEAPSD